MQNQDDDERNSFKEQCHKPSRENATIKNEIQALTMRMSKEIEDRKKNEEDISKSLKDRFDEWNRLEHDNDMLRNELVQS